MALPHMFLRVGRVRDRITDTWIFETLLGDPVSRPVELWFDSGQPKQPRRVCLDADGNVSPSPRDQGGSGGDSRQTIAYRDSSTSWRAISTSST